MIVVHMNGCTFEVNGEDRVDGTLSFLHASGDGVRIIFDVDKLPRGPIKLLINPGACASIADFFAKGYMYFWKVTVLAPESPYRDVVCIVSFSKEDKGVTIHLSLDFETEKMHIETIIDEDTLEYMHSIWDVNSEQR